MSRRSRVLEYIASQGGVLRSDSGTGLRRRIADALGERPSVVSQTLIGLERAGLIERELDVDRNRCHAIRLVPAGESPAPKRRPPRREHNGNEVQAVTTHLRAERDRLRRQLEHAELELGVAIRRGVELARRVEDLESKLKAALSLAARTPSTGERLSSLR